ncbi:MAG: hypothetical protein ACRYFZ_15670 [Janthinobacterium lividum]
MYVAGPVAPELRMAVQEGHTEQEVLLVPELPAGLREITLPDHRRELALQQAA